MKGGISIKKRSKTKRALVLYEVLLLTGIAICIFSLFLLFLLFKADTNASQRVEFVQLFGYWNDWLIEDNLKLNSSTSKKQIEFDSSNHSLTMTSSNKIENHKTSTSSDMSKRLVYSYQKNTTMNLKEIDSDFIILFTIHSALQSYKEVYHYYPKSLHSLTLEYPNNYLSLIPDNTHYTLLGEGYVLSYKGYYISSNLKEKIELHFYPSTNELIVAIANLPLARYTTASGKNPLPFKESKIEERVMNPNGGEGPLGTRGFVLQDNYAIHGTNKPSSIGRYITLGCIRLLNENIATLYPYIPIGTSIKVKEGKAPSTVFTGGLPALEVPDHTKDKNSNAIGSPNNNDANTEGSKIINQMNNSPNKTKCECSPNKTFYWRK